MRDQVRRVEALENRVKADQDRQVVVFSWGPVSPEARETVDQWLTDNPSGSPVFFWFDGTEVTCP